MCTVMFKVEIFMKTKLKAIQIPYSLYIIKAERTDNENNVINICLVLVYGYFILFF